MLNRKKKWLDCLNPRFLLRKQEQQGVRTCLKIKKTATLYIMIHFEWSLWWIIILSRSRIRSPWYAQRSVISWFFIFIIVSQHNINHNNALYFITSDVVCTYFLNRFHAGFSCGRLLYCFTLDVIKCNVGKRKWKASFFNSYC